MQVPVNSEDSGAVTSQGQPSEEHSNTLAIAGLAFCAISVVLYGTLFYFAFQLPSTAAELMKVKSDTPLLMRFMLIGGSACLLNLVALGLSGVALLQSARRNIPALLGTVISGLLVLSIMCVFALSLIARR